MARIRKTDLGQLKLPGIETTKRFVKSNKRRVVFKMPTQQHLEMLTRIAADGYGLKGKTRWISDAISEFVAYDFWMAETHELSGLAAPEKKQDMVDMDMAIWKQLRIAAIEYSDYLARQEPPEYEMPNFEPIVTSAILRKLSQETDTVSDSATS